MLYAPDSALDVRWRRGGPGRELLGDGTDVWPGAGAGQVGDVFCGGAEDGELSGVE